jgi:hypothetical protein
MLERKDIEGRDPYLIAGDLLRAFGRFCGQTIAAAAN